MVALGYPTMADAGDDIANLLRFRPTACEGLDRRIVYVVVAKSGAAAVPALPAGDGWMFLEVVGNDPAEVRARAEAIVEASAAKEGWVVDDPVRAAQLWKIRADGAGLAGVSLDEPAYGGWEDAAVPPQGVYLPNNNVLTPQMRSPEYVQMSNAAAIRSPATPTSSGPSARTIFVGRAG